MRLAPLALAVVASLASCPAAAPGAVIAEVAYDYGLRGVATAFGPPAPTFTYVPHASQFVAGSDGRINAASDLGLKFALGTALPPGASITSATLALVVVSTQAPTAGNQTVTFQVAGSAGPAGNLTLGEFGASYLSNSANIGTRTLPVNIGFGNPAAVSFDVTALLQSLAAGGAASLFVQLDDPNTGTNIGFATPVDANLAYRPTLTIVYASAVPEPGSLVLLAVGAGLVAASRRRQKIENECSTRTS